MKNIFGFFTLAFFLMTHAAPTWSNEKKINDALRAENEALKKKLEQLENDKSVAISSNSEGLVLTSYAFDSDDSYRLLGKVADKGTPPFSYGAHLSHSPKWGNFHIKEHAWSGFIRLGEKGKYDFKIDVLKNFKYLSTNYGAKIVCSYSLDIGRRNILKNRFQIRKEKDNKISEYFTASEPGDYDFTFKLGCDTRKESFRDKFKSEDSNVFSEVYMMGPSDSEYKPIGISILSHSADQL